MHLRYGGIFYYRFSINSLLSLTMKELLNSVTKFLTKSDAKNTVAPFSGHGVH